MNLVDILRKLGIYRSGSFSGTYKAENRPAEMMMDDVFDAKKDLINKNDMENLKKKVTKKSSNKDIEMKSKIKFGIVCLVAVFLLLVMASKTIWFFIGIVIWTILLFWLGRGEGKTASNGIIIGVVATAIFVSIILISFANPNSGIVTTNVSFEVDKSGSFLSKNEVNKTQMSQEETDVQAVVTLLNSLGKIIKTDSTQAVSMPSVVWTTRNTELVLDKSYTITLIGINEEKVKRLRDYFVEDLKATIGGVGFEYVAPVGATANGLIVSNEQFSSLMCVFALVNEKDVRVSCGYGPGGKANFVEKK